MRGKLRLYIGAAPGVGKTYKMLADARARQQESVLVMIGLIETHGRSETEAMIGDLPVVPLLSISYKGHELKELDVDTVLTRRPEIVLVDELAHTNAPGSMRAKRYQDVQVLLENGIDVYAAVNIQHFESLLLTVKGITGVEVRERIPDRFLNQADEILLVDVTPQTLQERMRQGKIYRPDKIEQSLTSFFTLTNLSSLREIALRQVADEVDDQVYRTRKNVVSDPTLLQERIMVCIQLNDNARHLMYRGFRMASRLKAKLYILSVLHSDERKLSPEQTAILKEVREQGESFQAEVIVLNVPRKEMTRSLTVTAREKRITQLILGQSARTRWQEVMRGSIVNVIMRELKQVDIHIVSDQT